MTKIGHDTFNPVSRASADDLSWAARIIGTHWSPDETVGLSIRGQDGNLRAVVAYNAFMDGGCCAHIASDGSAKWASRQVLWAMFALPFLQNNLRRVTLPIAAKNEAAQILALKLGFTFEGRIREQREDGDDEIIFGMLKRECRWIGGPDG